MNTTTIKCLLTTAAVFTLTVCANVYAQDINWIYHENEDDFGIKSHSLAVAGNPGIFDHRFAMVMGCSTGESQFFIAHAYTGATEGLRSYLRVDDLINATAKKSAEEGEIRWRVDKQPAESVTVDMANFSDGVVGVATKHLAKFIKSIYNGKEMIFGYKGGEVHKFPLDGATNSIRKFAESCNININ